MAISLLREIADAGHSPIQLPQPLQESALIFAVPLQKIWLFCKIARFFATEPQKLMQTPAKVVEAVSANALHLQFPSTTILPFVDEDEYLDCGVCEDTCPHGAI